VPSEAVNPAFLRIELSTGDDPELLATNSSISGIANGEAQEIFETIVVPIPVPQGMPTAKTQRGDQAFDGLANRVSAPAKMCEN
jgi:hypothetical protein